MKNQATTTVSADLLTGGLGAAAIGFAIAGQPDTAATFFLSFAGVGLLRVIAGHRVHLLPLAAALAVITSIGAIGAIAEADFWSPLGHFAGGVFMGIVLLPLTRGPRESRAPISRGLLLVGMVLLLGVGWELGELAVDAVLGTNLSPGATDTVLDLAADLAGGTVAALLSPLASRA